MKISQILSFTYKKNSNFRKANYFDIFFIFFISIINGQENIIKNDSISEYEYWNSGMIFTVQLGVWKPIGDLKKTFNINPSVGFKVSLPVNKKVRIGVGTKINIPLKSEPFMLLDDGKSFLVKSRNTVNGILGPWISYENRIGEIFFIDKYFGIGVGFIQTDKKKENSTNENDNWYGVETINFNFGLAIRKIALKKRSIGIFFEYDYSPYSLFRKVKKDFGDSSIGLGINYRF